jgi:hypothetical protein
MKKTRESRDADRRAIIAEFTRADFDRLNRVAHAKNLRSVVQCTKWLNHHGLELLRRHPEEFYNGSGMSVEQFLLALSVHVDCCRTFLKKVRQSPQLPQ